MVWSFLSEGAKMITSLGAGSGIDIESLVTKLVAAERDPVKSRLDRREATLQAQLSALGSFKSALSGLRGAVAALTGPTVFQGASAQSSDAKVFTARATTGAEVRDHQVEVTRLATAHGLATTAFTSKTEAIGAGGAGTGTLTFRFGTTSRDPDTGAYAGFEPNPATAARTIAITAANNSLEGIRDAVNAAGIGVNATIVKDDSGFRLVFAAAATGVANSLEIGVSETSGGNTDDLGLSRLAFNAGATRMTETRAAGNAELRIDGLAITHAGNRLNGVIEGLDIELTGTGTASLAVTADPGAATKAIDGFVRAYNAVVDNVRALTAVDRGTGRGSVLTGDSMLRSASNRLHALATGAIPGVGGALDSLAAIGIGTDPETGKLVRNEERFNKAVKENFAAIAPLFANAGNTSDALIRYAGAGKGTAIGEHPVQITRMATRAELKGGSVTEPLVITAGVNDVLTLTIDGVSSGTIRLDPGSYTGAALATELQTRVNGVSALSSRGIAVQVAFEGGRFTVTSARYGSASKVAASGAALATLGLDNGTAVAGVDVAGTIAGEAATGSGRRLTGTGKVAGLVLEIEGGLTGDRGTVSFSRGMAARLTDFVDSLIGKDDLIGGRTRGLEARIDAVGDQRVQLERRLAAIELRYRAQFIAMDKLVSQLQGTSNFLAQQLANLPSTDRRQ